MTDIINTIVFPICRRDYILTALRSLHANTPPNYKTIVVDQTDPSTAEDPWAFEEELWSEVRLDLVSLTGEPDGGAVVKVVEDALDLEAATIDEPS